MTSRRRNAFSLVELLVVVAVIALLISLLLPALARVKQTGRLLTSLNNVRQITAAAHGYIGEHDGRWPVSPGDASWHTLGATTSDHWDETTNERHVHERELNPYLYPDVDLIDPPEETGRGRIELPVYRCPGDVATYQRSWAAGDDPPEPDLGLSCYEDVGTSYHVNQGYWWLDIPEDVMAMPAARRWEELKRRTVHMFRRATVRKPSTFVWLFDQKFDLIVSMDADYEGDHGGVNKAVGAFLDGHAAYVRVVPGEHETDEYQVVFSRPGLAGEDADGP